MNPLYLPLIDDDMVEILEGSSLIVKQTNGRWEWTQDAVEFVCILNRQIRQAAETEVKS